MQLFDAVPDESSGGGRIGCLVCNHMLKQAAVTFTDGGASIVMDGLLCDECGYATVQGKNMAEYMSRMAHAKLEAAELSRDSALAEVERLRAELRLSQRDLSNWKLALEESQKTSERYRMRLFEVALQDFCNSVPADAAKEGSAA